MPVRLYKHRPTRPDARCPKHKVSFVSIGLFFNGSRQLRRCPICVAEAKARIDRLKALRKGDHGMWDDVK